MVLMPKLHKPRMRVRELRPILLQDILGKVAIRVVKQRIQPCIERYLESIPQYAYMSKREGLMAVSKATQHCRLVRDSTTKQVRTIYHKRLGVKGEDLIGGVTLALDLEQAFDGTGNGMVAQFGLPCQSCWQ